MVMVLAIVVVVKFIIKSGGGGGIVFNVNDHPFNDENGNVSNAKLDHIINGSSKKGNSKQS